MSKIARAPTPLIRNGATHETREENGFPSKASNALAAYLLSSVQKYKDHVSELLTSSAEQRLARVLLRLAHLDKRGPAVAEIPVLSHQVLAGMVGTERPRVNLFMNRFRKQGFIDYDGGLEVHQSLRKVLRRR